MCKKISILFVISLFVSIVGCSQIADIPKVILGSSTRALENARGDAISKTYQCSFNDCYEAVLSLARSQEVPEEQVDDEADVKIAKKRHFNIFIDNRKKRHIVVMGIPGNVETTEAGIFFSQPSLTTVKLEVTSLSSSAKRKVAQIIFDELDLRFSETQ